MDVKSDIYVDDRHSQEKVNVNMNILFPKLPCEFLDVDAFDSMGQMVKDENKMFRLYRTDSAQNIIEIYVRQCSIKRTPHSTLNKRVDNWRVRTDARWLDSSW
jgi:hypothetical protein